jgi:hypothetical protein
VNRLGRHAAHVTSIDEKHFVAWSETCLGGGIAWRSFADRDPAIGSRLGENGPDRTRSGGAAEKPEERRG